MSAAQPNKQIFASQSPAYVGHLPLPPQRGWHVYFGKAVLSYFSVLWSCGLLLRCDFIMPGLPAPHRDVHFFLRYPLFEEAEMGISLCAFCPAAEQGWLDPEIPQDPRAAFSASAWPPF